MKCYLSALFIIMNCVGCNLPADSTEGKMRNVEYLIICDTISIEMVNTFKDNFFVNSGIGSPLIQTHDPRYGDVHVSVYCASENSPAPCRAFFGRNNTNKDNRRKIADALIKNLEDKITSNRKSLGRNILISFSNTIDEFNDSAKEYHIIFYSTMIENSGVAITDDSLEVASDLIDGRFCFVNRDNYVKCSYLMAAQNQVETESGWINDHLIRKIKRTPQIKNISITIIKPSINLHNQEGEKCSDVDIDEFWTRLFHKMNLSIKTRLTTFNGFKVFE